MLSACFAGIGIAENGTDLTDIQVSGYPAGACVGMVSFQILDELGIYGPTYQYLDLDGVFAPGWYDENGNPVSKGQVILPVGQGLWTTSQTGIKFTFNGQVITDDIIVNLRQGCTAVGNMMATSVDLTDILVDGVPAGSCVGMLSFQILDSLGIYGPTYQYLDLAGVFAPGWYDENGVAVEKETVFLTPGQGIWVTAIDGASMTFPAPEL